VSGFKPTLRGFAAVLFALGLVTTAAGAGVLGPGAQQVSDDVSPVQPAAAALGSDCSNVDYLVHMVSFQIVNRDKCSWGQETVPQETVDKIKESDAQQAKVDIYNQVLAYTSRSEGIINTGENALRSSETYAWSKARATVIDAYQNGTSKALAKAKARAAVADYYSRMMVNKIRQYNTSVSQLAHLRELAKNESGVSKRFIAIQTPNQPRNLTKTVVQVELPNGTQVSALAALPEVANAHASWHVPMGPQTDSLEPSRNIRANGLQVQAPTSSYEPHTALRFHDWRDFFANITATQQRLNDNVGKFVNGTWSGLETGEINASQTLNGATLAQEYATDYNGTGYYSYAVASLASMGLHTPNLGETARMNVSYQGTTYTGLLMSQYAPNKTDGWVSGTTYDAATIDGMQLVVTQDGGKIPLQGEFSVGTLYTRGGGTINRTNIQQYNFRTTNVTEYNQLQEQLLELRKEIESREPTVGSGGNGGSGVPADSPYVIGGLALVALALLYANRGESGG